MEKKVKNNWRYYKYKETHIIQSTHKSALQFESKTKSGVIRMVNNFIKNKTKLTIKT